MLKKGQKINKLYLSYMGAQLFALFVSCPKGLKYRNTYLGSLLDLTVTPN